MMARPAGQIAAPVRDASLFNPIHTVEPQATEIARRRAFAHPQWKKKDLP
ncbi:hypothetical protein RSPO_m00922 (plasmid) [Ralstonia solanacearum Po82]|uniref:Uncharacterized protein n=1 Tax=Ralstonia solanacearum (strain Po82) TaxID=1031711 RepID=F6G943_RALS8|nr:hypothetical protein RSPO_m00922 [Ralstonia solanacearum Po82]